MRGSIYSRAEGSWTLKYDAGRDPVSGKRKIRYATVAGTKAKAERELRRLVSQVDEGTQIDPSRLTLADWIKAWLRDHVAAAAAIRTHERYSELLRLHVEPKLGAVALQKVTPAGIQAIYAALLIDGKRVARKAETGDGAPPPPPAGLSAQSVLHVHRALSKCLKVAVRQRLLSRNPCDDATPPSPKRVQREEGAGPKIRALDIDGVDKLLRALRASVLFPIVATAFGTGMRRGEILALQWGDADLEAGTLRVERSVGVTHSAGVQIKAPKNEASRRTIGIDPGLAGLLRAEWKRQAEASLKMGQRLPSDALIFPSSIVEPAKPRHPDSVTKEFVRMATEAGFPGFRLHDCRHTHATLLLLAGVPVHAVAQRLGHSSPVVTMTIYAHVLKRAEDRATEVAGELLKGALASVPG